MFANGVLRNVLLACGVASLAMAKGNTPASRFAERKLSQQKRNADMFAHAHGFDTRQESCNNTDYRFLNNQTQPYQVTSLPEVNFDLGEMYSGSIPITEGDDSRTLFFLFQPTINDPVDEVTIWFNGGPGCSSLEGFLQENGRFVWPPGTYAPYINPYSWVNLTNMLWVEQPVGTGFSQGTPNATNEEMIAADFISWFKNFQDTFGIKNFKIYVTGESYAGRYVPYVSAAMLDQNNTEYYNLSGALVYDPCIGSYEYLQEEVTAVPFAIENNVMLNLNESYLNQLVEMHNSCGYQDYIDKYYAFPPAGMQPPLYYNASNTTFVEQCDVFDAINNAVLEVNNCFNIYSVNQNCPIPWDVLGFPTDLVYSEGPSIYFNRSDVKAALHAPNISWSECANNPVFVGNGTGPEQAGDTSPDPIQGVLPKVIEATGRVLVGNGDYDMIIITNGTLMSIQNMTWNGQMGFQTKPNTTIDIQIPDLLYQQAFIENGYAGVDGPQGVMGIQHYERGLMWAETFQSGHMQPEFQPRASYRHLQWLLGHTDTL